MKTGFLIFAAALTLASCNSKSVEAASPAADSVAASAADTSVTTVVVKDTVATPVDTVATEVKKLPALTAADFVSSFYNEDFGRKVYSYSCKESSLKKKGFTRKGNKWTRTDGDVTTTIAVLGDDMDETIKITFGTPEECKAFIATLKKSGLTPSQYGGANTYSSGIGDMDITATTTPTTVTFSY